MPNTVPSTVTLSAIVFQEDGWFCARFLEYDMAVQAKTLPDLHYEAQRLIVSHLAIAEELKQEPFAGLSPAPKKYWEMFEHAPLTVAGQRSPFRLPHPISYPSIVPEYRVA